MKIADTMPISGKTAEKHYSQAGTLEASRRCQETLRKLRQDLDKET